MMHGSMNEFPDLYYVFLTNSPDQLGELVRGAQTVRQSHSRQEHFKVITANEISAIGTFGPELRAHLNTIPMRIMSPFCRNGSQDYVFDRESGGFVFNEDYISPNVEHRYRIATDFLLDTEHVQVTVCYDTLLGQGGRNFSNTHNNIVCTLLLLVSSQLWQGNSLHFSRRPSSATRMSNRR